MARRFPPVVALASTLLAAPDARSDGTLGNLRCDGPHSLWAPVPDACLEVIDTDRPHQTDTPHVVPAGHVQVESAVGEVELGGTLGAPAGDRKARVILFDDGYKFGLVSNVDLELLLAHAAYVPDQGHFEPAGPLSVRAKLNVVQASGWVPAVTLVPWVFLPLAPSEGLRGGPLVFWEWALPGHMELEMNAGMLLGVKPKPATALVVASALTYTVIGELRTFIDVYATGPDVALGTGALWAFTRDMQVDVGTYVGLNGDEPVATPFLGFSIRR
jgi:hypothetical protein